MIDPHPSEALRRLVTSCFVSQGIYVVAKLDLAERFAAGPQTTVDVARAAGLHEGSLFRLVRALADVGVFVDEGGGRFSLGPLGACLRRDAPDSMRATVIWLCEGPYRAASGLVDTVRSGTPPAALSPDPATDRELATLAGRAVVEAVDLGGVQCLVALGDAAGALLAPILAAYPSICGLEGLSARGEVFALGHGLSRVCDAGAAGVLADLRRAVPPAARVLVVERLIPRSADPAYGRILDMVQLTVSSGRERTEAEFASLFSASGFELACVIPTRAGLHVLEAVPV